ncbi:MAG: glutaredoxin domain-containing protein [bacterium]|nr:glutaredoxin domain-containing protein [bacterium]
MKLILYTKVGCGWCVRVRDFLTEKKVPFEEREVLTNKAFFDELLAKSEQTKTPTLDLDGAILADTDKDAVEVFLRQRHIL